MKKLLAVAVAVAFAAPAMADTSVYGRAHLSLDKVSGVSANVVNHSSRIGVKGSNALDNGLTATHKFEFGINIADPSGGLSDRDAWVGLKGGFGEVRFGRHTLPSDLLDDHADFLTNGERINMVPGRQNNALAYIGSFGPVTVAAAHVADGGATTANKANDIAVAYKAGPFQASVGVVAPDTGSNLTGVALSYSGANYGVGYKHGKVGSAKQDTITGKYSFGKAYVAAGYGKMSSSSVKTRVLELGYKLGKGTKAYYEYSKDTDSASVDTKTNRLGLYHNF